MTNLAPVLAQLQEALANQSESGSTWQCGALIVVKTDEKGAETAFIRATALDTVVDQEAQDALTAADLFVDEGRVQTLRAGKSERIKAFGIKLTELNKLVHKTRLEASRAVRLEGQVKTLQRELRIATEATASTDSLEDMKSAILQHYGHKAGATAKPFRFNRTKPSATKALAGIPTLMLSDWHYGEVVDPAQINHLNSYDLSIAEKRGNRVFSTAQELLFHHQSGQSYDGAVVVLAGDMLSGNIHEELRMTNDAPVLECLLSLSKLLARNIAGMAENFEWLYVPCVPGNHGRVGLKPTSKLAVKDNYDWILYHMVAAEVKGMLGDRCNVEFDISDSLDMRYNLYKTRYLLTHGDQIKGGSGAGGFWPTMFETAMKKNQREVTAGREGFDYMLCGHFHTYGAVSNVIVNGSLKGYDEWVYRMNFGIEGPIQALWTTHPEYGIIDRRPIYAAEPETSDLRALASPVTTFRNGRQLSR